MSSTNFFKEKIITSIAEQKLKINICDLNTEISENIHLKKALTGKKPFETLSPTEVMFGELVLKEIGEIPISVKMFIDYRENYDSTELKFGSYEALYYEAKVYKYISDEIVNKQVSPNFISYIASGSCDYNEIKKFASCEGCPESLYYGKKGNKVVPRSNKIFLIITENASNGKKFDQKNGTVRTLHQLLDENIDKEISDKIIFQLLFALEVMYRKKIVHNDLHSNNILVTEYENPITMAFIYENGSEKIIFKIETRFVPYIFDWDFAFVQKLGNNKRYEYEKNSTLNAKKDLYTLLRKLKIPEFMGKTARSKEEEVEIKILLSEAKEIEKFPFFENIPNVYKLDRTQLHKIFGNKYETMFPGSLLNIVLVLSVNRNIAKIKYYNAKNTMGAESINFKDPSYYIESKNFMQYRTNNISDVKPYLIFNIENLNRDTYDNLFYSACKQGNFTEIKKFLESGINPNKGLYFACETGNINLYNFFLENNATDIRGCYSIAENNKQENMVEYIEKIFGIKKNLKDYIVGDDFEKFKKREHEIINPDQLFMFAIQSGKPKFLKFLYQKSRNKDLLEKAIEYCSNNTTGNMVEILKILLELGAENFQPVFMAAIENQKLDVVKFCLENELIDEKNIQDGFIESLSQKPVDLEIIKYMVENNSEYLQDDKVLKNLPFEDYEVDNNTDDLIDELKKLFSLEDIFQSICESADSNVEVLSNLVLVYNAHPDFKEIMKYIINEKKGKKFNLIDSVLDICEKKNFDIMDFAIRISRDNPQIFEHLVKVKNGEIGIFDEEDPEEEKEENIENEEEENETGEEDEEEDEEEEEYEKDEKENETENSKEEFKNLPTGNVITKDIEQTSLNILGSEVDPVSYINKREISSSGTKNLQTKRIKN